MENIEYCQNLKTGLIFSGDWFFRSQWSRLRLPRQKENGLRLKEGPDGFLAAPNFKTVVWPGRHAVS